MQQTRETQEELSLRLIAELEFARPMPIADRLAAVEEVLMTLLKKQLKDSQLPIF